jgi:hypothetical protein
VTPPSFGTRVVKQKPVIGACADEGKDQSPSR